MLDLLRAFVDLFLHLDDHLQVVIRDYGTWTYAILFAVVFCETGLVVTPILPGDSLLFAAGAFAAAGSLDLAVLLGLLTVAAVLGDTVNYWIGKTLGRSLVGRTRFIRQAHVDRTHAFYEKYGPKTIVLARFVPIVRTFAPFVAGAGEMPYARFMTYNVVGGVLWVVVCTVGGYLFGNLPVVKANFELVLIGIILVSVAPTGIEMWRARQEGASPTA